MKSGRPEQRRRNAWVEEVDQLLTSTDLAAAGNRMYRLIADLYPICRSISGDGFRQTLRRLREQVPLELDSARWTGERIVHADQNQKQEDCADNHYFQ